jgi:catechol 2,3-dioxygenase-like lactoylglutathione lyase family enzyme
MTAHALDHVALAVREWGQASVLAERYGGRWLFGTTLPTHSPAQLLFAQDMRVELLEPGTAADSFIRRFLDEDGTAARPHHLTFKVRDIRASLAAAEAAGFEPILVNLENDFWMEYFLHPSATGLGFLTQVVQGQSPTEDLVEKAGDLAGTPPWPVKTGARAALPLLLARVGSTDQALALLCGLLGGVASPVAEGATRIRWPQGADLVLTPAAEGLPLGVHTLVFSPDGRDDWDGADLAASIESGRFHAALGTRIAELEPVRRAPAAAG